MAEYIKREDVEEMIKEWFSYSDDDDFRRLQQSAVAELPSINIRDGAVIMSKEAYSDLCLRASERFEAERIKSKRPKGEWMPIIEANELGDAYKVGIYCSECGETLSYEANFCPNCGADMRGDKE